MSRTNRLLLGLLVLLLGLGLLFRLAYLDQKVFWVDEVATVIRAAGYTKADIIYQLTDGAAHTPADLLAYQQLTSDRTFSDTIHALIQSPEHAPLYFLLTRLWMHWFGSAPSAVRSLSVVCSLLVLPAVFWLCQELFGTELAGLKSRSAARIGGMAVALIAVSPFFVAYAQEARPYSLWLLTIVLSSAALLRSIRLNTWSSWATYMVLLILSLYTSLLSLLLAIGQGFYVLSLERWFNQTAQRYLWASGGAMLAFLPWIWVILHHRVALEANTTWMRTLIHPLVMLAVWLYSFAVLFFDVPVATQFGWLAIGQAILAAIVLAVIGYACYQLAQLPRRIWLFIAALWIPIPLVLVLLDLFFQGQASATPRYLMPCQFGILLAVAFFCAAPTGIAAGCSVAQTQRIANRARRFQQSAAGLVLSLSLLSCWVNIDRSPDYQKDRNRHNPEIAALLNQVDQAAPLVLLAEPAQTIDLLSLSHSLDRSIQIQILSTDRLLETLEACRSDFLFNPSSTLVEAAQKRQFQLTLIYQPQLLTSADIHLSLWQIKMNKCKY